MPAKERHHCHVLLRSTAIEMAEALYEELMHDNDWYYAWRKTYPGKPARFLEKAFVRKTWPGLVPQAKATLGALLAQPINPLLKDQIHEALILDNSLPSGKVQSVQGA